MKSRCRRNTILSDTIVSMYMIMIRCVSLRFRVGKELREGTYQPQANRKVEIPKTNGKMRTLQIPTIRDRVVQGALKLILEAIFEADFCPNSYGFRPKRSPHQALAGVRRSVLRRMTTVIDIDLEKFSDINFRPKMVV